MDELIHIGPPSAREERRWRKNNADNIEFDCERYQRRQLDLHRKERILLVMMANARLKIARYRRPVPAEDSFDLRTTRSICASMLAGRAGVIAEMHKPRAHLKGMIARALNDEFYC